MDAHA
jgi:hypothetical protein